MLLLVEAMPQKSQLCVPDGVGITPMNNPDESGQLIYPICLDGIKTSALLDYGASYLFY